MPSLRPLHLAAALSFAVGLSSCKTPAESPSQSPAGAVTPAPLTADASGGETTTPETQVQKIEITGSITNLADIFGMLKDVTTRWSESGGVDPYAQIQSALLQTSFAPSFLDNLDLVGTHVVRFSYPHKGGAATMRDADLAATIAVVDGRRVIEGTPPGVGPQPLGEGLWELKTEALRLLFREAGRELLIGSSNRELNRATELRAQVKGPQALRVKVTNLPSDALDPMALMGISGNDPVVRGLSGVMQGLKAIEWIADMGTARDAAMTINAEAPFHKLGLGPLGQPRTSPTELEQRLPPSPMAVTTLSWGDPTLVQKLIASRVPTANLPEPFAGIAKQAIEGATGLLGQISHDVIVALYIDDKGQLSVAIAADVKDDAAATASLGAIMEAARKGAEAQQILAGNNRDSWVQVEWKPASVSVTKGKADRLVVRPPKTMKLAELAPDSDLVMTRGALELFTVVRGKTAVMVFGPGGRKMLAKIATAVVAADSDHSLAEQPGLRSLRQSMGGCQICATIDPVQYARFRLAHRAEKQPSSAKAVKEAQKALKKVGPVGEPSVGVRLEADYGVLGAFVPKALIFAEPAAVAAVRQVIAVLESEDPTSGGAPAGLPKGSF